MERTLAIVDLLSSRIGSAIFVFMPVMVVVLVFEVVARYLFNAPTIWIYDTALIIYAWIGFVGGALVQHKRGHIRVDILTSWLSPRGQATLELITLPLAFYFLALVSWQCSMAAFEAIASGVRRSTDWAPPLVLFILPAAVGAGLLMLQLLADGIRAALLLLNTRTKS